MLRRSLAIALLFVLTSSFPLGGCGDEGSKDPTALPGGAVVRIEVSPPGALFAGGATDQTFDAKAFDAAGNPVAATFTWSSNAADVVSVTPDGPGTAKARASKALGSALITAEAGGVKATVLAVAAEVAPGAVLVRDDQIVGLPTPVDAAAPFGPGYRYKVQLAGASAPAGAMLLSTGGKTVAGRVVSVDGAFVTVEQVTLNEAIPRLDIAQTLDLTQSPSLPSSLKPLGRPPGLRTLAEKEFKVGPLDCSVEGTVGALELNKKEANLEPLRDLTYEIVWNDQEKKIAVRGQPKVTFELEPVVKGQIEGKVSCKLMLREIVIPVPGPLGLFLGAAVPIGVGVDVGAKAVVTEAGVNLKGEASAKLAFGFRCNGDRTGCTPINEIEPEGTLTPRWIPPNFALEDIKFEPEVSAYAWAQLEGGARFSSTVRVEAIDAQAGFKLQGSLAREETQAKQADYASSYKLAFDASIGPSGAVESFLRLVDVAVAFLQFQKEIPIGESPAGGTLTASPGTFAAGETVHFALSLDPAKLTFPVVGYNVESVRIYRKEARPDGSLGLILANEAVAQPNQKDFAIDWVATVDSAAAKDGFVAFVKTKLTDLRLEGPGAAFLGASGGITMATGEKAGAMDALTTVFPPKNAGDAPLAAARMFFSFRVDGLKQCAKAGDRFERSPNAFFEIGFAKANALAAGTYTFQPADQPFADGKFAGSLNTRTGACVEGTSLPVLGGTLMLTEASPGQFAGTINVQVNGGTGSGTFTIPACSTPVAEFGVGGICLVDP